ncbi:TIGR02301 family protein [Xanthobacter sp. DSM 24535]|uniref:TIGR02301 family protein n=1 Tax=Roseixanthobacter psychrophilus TaxID=3119917 RepID=UPI00372C2743
MCSSWTLRSFRALRILPAMLLAVLLGLAGAPARAADGSTPPYETDMLKLAELLGGLHYLRPLCGMSAESQSWRLQMQDLLDAEQPSEDRKAKLIAAFNQGYSSYAQVYRVCTPAATAAVQRQLAEGAKLAHDIVVRFGGN